MKRELLIFALVMMGTFFNQGRAQDFDCETSSNLPQIGLNYCTYQSYQKADKQLNKVWQNARLYARSLDKNAPEFALPKAEKNLLKAQRAWIDYRDGHCEVEAASWAGGSGQSMIRNSCLAHVTKLRVKELREVMNGN